MNYKKIIKILLLITGISAFIVSLILFIGSFQKYDDGFGISFTFNYDYGMFIVLSLILTITAIYILNKDQDKLPITIALLVASGLFTCYSLGVFFTAVFDSIKYEFALTFKDHYLYLIVGILCLLNFIRYIFQYISIKKSED